MKIDITAIKNWFQLAKPNPTIDDACTQVGCHYEECGEMALITADDSTASLLNEISEFYKKKTASYVDDLSCLARCDESKIELLDALCDQIVTAIGVAHMLGMDIEGALQEVNRSNWSKFVDGKPVFNEDGKIAKPETYTKPNLEGFVK